LTPDTVPCRQPETILVEVIDYARKDVQQISDPKVQALFETTTEMLIAIRRAFEQRL
jgi:hypothetical protein